MTRAARRAALSTLAVVFAASARAGVVEIAPVLAAAPALVSGPAALAPMLSPAASPSLFLPATLAPLAPSQAPILAAAAALPALPARMASEAEAYGRPFKAIPWSDGDGPGGIGDRDPQRIHKVVPGPDGRAVLERGGLTRPIREGERLLYVLLADGTMEAGVPGSVDESGRAERGVKHMQVADGRPVVFAGELTRRGGRLVIDLESGGFSSYGLDPRWRYSARHASMLKRYAQEILAEPVSVARRP